MCIRDSVGGDRLTLRLREFTPSAEAETAQALLRDLACVKEVIVNPAQGNSLNLVVADGSTAIGLVQSALQAANLPIFGLAQSRPSLDDVYLAATGRTLLDAELAAASRRDLKAERKQAMR